MPLSTTLPPLISARVVRSVSAEPACGSDIETATWMSPRHTAGTTRCLSVAEAKRSIARTGPDAGFEDREGDGGGHLAEFLQHEQRLDVAEAKTAERFGHVDAEEAEFGEFAHQRLVGRVIRFFAFAGHRGQPFLRVASGGFLQGALFVGELEIHGRTWTSIWSPATRTG